MLKKRGRESIPLSYPNSLNNDDIYIQLVDDKNIIYTIDSLRKKKVGCIYYENGEKRDIEIDIRELRKYKINVEYYYKNFRVSYDNILESYFHVLFGVVKFQWRKHERYTKNVKSFHNRMEVLKKLIKLRTSSTTGIINIRDLCEELYGKRYMMYQEYPHLKEYDNLRFELLSLKQSGDVTFKDEVLLRDVKLLPKSSETISNYETEMSKHIDSLKITRYQLFVMIVMAILALSNLVLGILSYVVKS